MRKLKLYVKALLFLLALSWNTPGTTAFAAKNTITLSLPESVLAEATTALLPLKIDAHSKALDGDITIIKISNLQLTNGHLGCRLHLAGNNLAFLTEIAGHQIRLKVGAVQVAFQTDAAVRYDAKRQILYLKPVVKNMTATGDGANDEIGRALVALLNGREFPISMQKLDPIVADAGAKSITINTRIVDIQAKPDILVLNLAPKITTK